MNSGGRGKGWHSSALLLVLRQLRREFFLSLDAKEAAQSHKHEEEHDSGDEEARHDGGVCVQHQAGTIRGAVVSGGQDGGV